MKNFIKPILVTFVFALTGFAFTVNLNAESSSENPPSSVTAETRDFPSDSIVGIVQSNKANAEDIDFDELKSLIREAVRLAGGLEDIIKDGDTVVLKPNLVQAIDHTGPMYSGKALNKEVNGITTSYRTTKAVAQLVRELNPSGKIYIMEGSSVSTQRVYRALNYTKEFIPEVDEILAIERDSGPWRRRSVTSPDLAENNPALVRVDLPDGLYRTQYYFNRRFYEADVIIDLPCLKNHSEATVTGAIKNFSIGATPANVYGNNSGDPNRNSMINHGIPDFHKWIADYYTCRPADFVITEGLHGIEHGPSVIYHIYGSAAGNIQDSQKNMRVMLASKDGLAIDTVQTNIMNWDHTTVPYLQHLTAAGKTGNGDTKNIIVLGKKVDDIRNDFRGREPLSGGKRLTNKTPPTLSIISAAFEGNNLKLNLNVSNDTDKLDIYIDGDYSGSVKNNFAEVTFPAEGITNGSHNITVYSFNKHIFHAEDNAAAVK